MPTLLTNPKMDPALAARVEASVRGKVTKSQPRGIYSRRAVVLFRVALAMLVVGVFVLAFVVRRRARQQIEDARTALQQAIDAEARTLTDSDRSAIVRIESEIAKLAGPYPGDFVAPELKLAGALRTKLSRPTIYLRGTLEGLSTPTRIEIAAETSRKDALVQCLFDPPTARAENVVLAKIRESSASLASVYELRDLLLGMPSLQAPFAARVAVAKSKREIEHLRYAFEHAPIAAARRAARAEQLLVAIDEPGEGSGFSELEGDRPHFVRVMLVDLATSAVALRVRKRVDPAWITASRRVQNAFALDSCVLALDIRESVSPELHE